MTTTRTIFTKSGHMLAIHSARSTFEEVIFEAKWEAARRGDSVIVKEGFFRECGAEAVAIVTKDGEVF